MRNAAFAEEIAEILLPRVFELSCGKTEGKVARFCVENIRKWGEWFPEDFQGRESCFRKTLDQLRRKFKGDFPENFEFFSALDEERGMLHQIKEELMKLSAKMVASKKL